MNILLARICAGLLLGGGLSLAPLISQDIPSPESFLGYSLGSRFTLHHRVVDYVETLATVSPRMELLTYGTTPEGRPLQVLLISSPENLKRKEVIRHNNRIRAGLETGEVQGPELPVIWMNYNLHGDEAVSTEVAMEFLYRLAAGSQDTAQWLDEMVILVDPCANPDGRDHYVSWFLQAGTLAPSASPNTWEHHPPWPEGRFNHYLFDLNRDWIWQTQPETRMRNSVFRSWLPQVLVDFHEMRYESPYFFAPAARPYHEEITAWQLEFAELTGNNHARYFVERGWDYFTSKVYDLFYPSYGDTYGMFNGAVGFTYEQGGGGLAGLSVIRQKGDTLSLKDRYDHHLCTSFSTLEVVFKHRERLLEEQALYFRDAERSPNGPNKSYIIKGSNPPDALKAFTELLDRHEIRWGLFPSAQKTKRVKGFAYRSNDTAICEVEPGDLVLSTFQPQSRLLKVLMEPHPSLEDSLTYDLTAWSLPYAFGLEAYALAERVEAQEGSWPESPAIAFPARTCVYLFPWKDLASARLLAGFLKKGFGVGQMKKNLETANGTFNTGAFWVLVPDSSTEAFGEVMALAPYHGMQCLDTIPDSSLWVSLLSPKIALVGGEKVSPSSFGEMWHFLEKDLEYPLDLLLTDYLATVDLNPYEVVVLPSGNYKEHRKQLLAYARSGGRLVILEEGLTSFSTPEAGDTLSLAMAPLMPAHQKLMEEKKAGGSGPSQRYEDKDRTFLSHTVSGSIYRIQLSPEDPLSYGCGEELFLVKRNPHLFSQLPAPGRNAGTFGHNSYVSGFVGADLKKNIPGSLAIGRESYGGGEVIYLTDSPLLRGFWYTGKLLMGNALLVIEDRPKGK